jgi:hypothetical protein
MLLVAGSFLGCNTKAPVFPVEYRVTFIPTWTVNTHPVNYPSNAQFSPFITYSHKPDSDVFTLGLLAPDYLTGFAENGSTSALLEQIDVMRSSSHALDRAYGETVTYPQVSEVILGFDDSHTYCTILSKIEPSPDWFIAADSVNLKQGGIWVDTISVKTKAFDAGIDAGSNFNSPAQSQVPPLPVQVITTSPLATNGTVKSMATIGFKRVK